MALRNIDAVFSALPTALVILKPDTPDFTVERVNKAFLNLTDSDAPEWKLKPFFEKISTYAVNGNGESINVIQSSVQQVLSTKKTVETEILEFDLEEGQSSEQENIYLQFKCSPVLNDDGNVDVIVVALDNVTSLLSAKDKSISGTQRMKSREELQNQSENLADQAAHSKAQYESASQELDDFVYSVSHDLRAPLRRIDGFSQELLNSYIDQLDETGVHYLERIRKGAQDMGDLIDDLLKLSRISRRKLEKKRIDLGQVAREVYEELKELEPEREISIKIEKNLEVYADPGLLKAMLSNLISNALKFTANREVAEIEIGSKLSEKENIFYISDNGVGFDPAYKHKLFKAFSRLHSKNQFSGTGIGLATVKRIMTLHGGTIWAESTEGEGATFYFKF